MGCGVPHTVWVSWGGSRGHGEAWRMPRGRTGLMEPVWQPWGSWVTKGGPWSRAVVTRELEEDDGANRGPRDHLPVGLGKAEARP